MPTDYTALVAALKATDIPFAEYGWDKRLGGDYGVIALEFEAETLWGDDQKIATAYEGSVDLFMQGRDLTKIAAVEGVLTGVCDGCWRLESVQHETETGLIHYEWVFQVEG